jgi:hypothetical protein
MPTSNIVCITPEPEDNYDSFGYPVAINNKYLAIGDYLANRVVIYSRENSGQWNRSKIVLPPKDSTSERIGYGFSDKLQLDGDFLVVNSSVERYSIKLDSETEVKPIALPSEKSVGSVTFNLFSFGKIRQVNLPDKGEEGFGTCFTYCNNLLLVGSPSRTNKTGAWLYDLDRLDCQPEKLAIPNVYIGETVALNDEFAVVGDAAYSGGPYRPLPQNISNRPKSTLIKAIESGLTTTIQRTGKLSLSGDILGLMYPSSTHFVEGGVVELYRLNKTSGYRHILTRANIANALVQNGFLVTTYDNYELARHEIHIQEIV